MKTFIEVLAVTGITSHLCWLGICWLAKNCWRWFKSDQHVAMFEHAYYEHVLQPFDCRTGRCRKLTQ